jgi:hypothetical protein
MGTRKRQERRMKDSWCFAEASAQCYSLIRYVHFNVSTDVHNCMVEK